ANARTRRRMVLARACRSRGHAARSTSASPAHRPDGHCPLVQWTPNAAVGTVKPVPEQRMEELTMDRITTQSSEVLLARVNRELEQISDTQHRLARRKLLLQQQAT